MKLTRYESAARPVTEYVPFAAVATAAEHALVVVEQALTLIPVSGVAPVMDTTEADGEHADAATVRSFARR